MSEPRERTGPDDDRNETDDPVLDAAGVRLRERSPGLDPVAVELGALRRRSRRRGLLAAAAAVVAVAAMAGAVLAARDDAPDLQMAAGRPGAPAADEVERILAGLDDQPVDPTEVELVPTVTSYADCGALMDDLRRVGAEHVGSRGFGGFGTGFDQVGWAVEESGAARNAATAYAADTDDSAGGAGGGETLGTNVQVEGVDELDFVKAEGALVYDLDGRGNLRVTDPAAGQVLSTLDVTPGGGDDEHQRRVSDLLVADAQVVVFGSEVEVSDPVEGDPSATRAAVPYLTVTFVDAADPAAPSVTDRVRIEGSLVSARLVAGEVRMVTTSNMADLGFVMPTTPASVATALDQNRRTVASSTAADWVPDWQRDGRDPEPLVPCDRVYVPDTFAGVAMTSMVTFPMGDAFAPAATSIVAPATTLYAGTEKVAISSEVWVDPIDRERLEFDDWRTAVHEFAFADDEEAPTYVGSGVVDGSTVGQFAFGEVGGALAVVTTSGTPWAQQPDVAIDMTIMTPDGSGGLDPAAAVTDIADGEGAVAAVRFVDGRVLVSTGFFGRQVLVIDVSDPAAPRRAGRVSVPGEVGYFHPLPDHRALLVGSRTDQVGSGDDRRSRGWVQAHLLDVSDPDAPVVVATWERPWTYAEVGYDHHAFTYWPEHHLALWGLMVDRPGAGELNEAAVLGTDGDVTEVAVPVANQPAEVPPPCPAVELTDAQVRELVGPNGVVLHCGDPDVTQVEWPRYECYGVDDGTVAQYVPEDQRDGSYLVCSPAPKPVVRRVLVVAGTPYLLTDQTLEALDPETFASTAVTSHPSSGGYGY